MGTNDNKSDKAESQEAGPSPLQLARPSIEPNLNGDKEQSRKVESLETDTQKKERLELLFTAVIAFSAVVSASVAAFQWHTMDRQLDEMRGSGQQTDRLIAQITEQTHAANRLAAIARESLDESRRQFQQDRRPYVTIHAVPLQFAPGKEILVNLFSGNSGKSLAVKVGGNGHIFLGDDALQQAYRWFDTEANSVFSNRAETIIPPGITPRHIDAIRSTLRTGRVIGKEEFKLITQKDFSIVVGFRQAYLDTAGNKYWTDICVMYLATNAIAYCPQHNKTE